MCYVQTEELQNQNKAKKRVVMVNKTETQTYFNKRMGKLLTTNLYYFGGEVGKGWSLFSLFRKQCIQIMPSHVSSEVLCTFVLFEVLIKWSKQFIFIKSEKLTKILTCIL